MKIIFMYDGKNFDTLSQIRAYSGLIFPELLTDTQLNSIGITVKEVFPTEEELKQQALEEAKQERAEAVANIKVTVDGMVFDGDETSQTRMSRSIVALNDGEKILWVLANNTPVQVTKEQLKQALRLAGEAQTKVWADPYKVNEVKQETPPDDSLAKVDI